MLLDARELPRDEVLRADLCVMGAGAAGITLARQLAGTGIDVVVLESGGLEPDPATQALAAGEVVGEPLISRHDIRDLDEVRLRYFGGTTNHWAGYCRPLEDIDFERRPHLDVSGWPFGPEELAPWYERATEVLRLAASRYDLAWWQQEHRVGDALVDTDVVTTSMFQVQFPFSLGAAYRDALEQREDVRVVLWANATRLALAENADRVDAVEVQTLDGKRLSVEARAYVLALGGIENPRLLLASDDRRPAGIGNDHDLVGRYFAEHLQVLAGFATLHRSPGQIQLYAGRSVPAPAPDDPENTIEAKGVLVLTPGAMRDHELLGMEAQLLVAEPRAHGPVYRDGLTAGDVGRLTEIVDTPPGASTAFVQVLAEQELQPDSRVSLGDERDALGMRRVRLDWRHSELDRRSILAGLDLLARELGRLGLGRLQVVPGGVLESDPTEEGGPLSIHAVAAGQADPDSFPIGIGYHHLCTTRMSDDPTRGVVDRDCRVHGVGNLFVAGSSAFATGGVATPTLTICALALRLAEHLRARVLR